MFKLFGFLCGMGLMIFVVQPWVVDHYPRLYQQGKTMADKIIDTAKTIEVPDEVVLPPVKDLVLDVQAIETQEVPEPEEQMSTDVVIITESPQAITNVMIRKPIWSAFKYKTSANAFARQIRDKTKIDVQIERDAMGSYQLVLEVENEQIFQQQIAQIEQALGLNFSQLIVGQ
ncbi:MAG TPA: hypothetical protein ENJ60_08280 [Aeromonadales bacterium]|nr:hypothetical protein [Aeromonadales bacterium]